MADRINETIRGVVPAVPTVAMRGAVVFPHTFIHFDIVRARSLRAVERAMKEDNFVLLLGQRDFDIENPLSSDLYTVGVYSKIKQIVQLPNNSARVLMEGIQYAKVVGFSGEDFLLCDIEGYEFNETCDDPHAARALIHALKENFEVYYELSGKMQSEIAVRVMNSEELELVCNHILSAVDFSPSVLQQFLEERDVLEKANHLLTKLLEENEVLALKREILERTKESLDKSQRDYFLREEMKEISAELGSGLHAEDEDYREYAEKIEALKAPDEAREKLRKELGKLAKLSPYTPEAGLLYNYFDTVLSMPWASLTREKTNLEASRKILERDHYGLEKVKERILEYLAVRQLAKDVRTPILCLAGPPGVGKTSIARSIAEATGRKYAHVSLGGVKDEAEIRGHRKTYLGAMPGRVIDALIRVKSQNPLLLFDEIDKLSSDYKGDPASAMLEVLDPDQNFAFCDHYIEVPFDLSKALFVTTANDLGAIPRPLLDRMEVIEISGYTPDEKFHIAKEHLLPKQMKNHGLMKKTFTVTDSAIQQVIGYYTREAGVRGLERVLAKLCRKAARELVSGAKKVAVSERNLETYLGKHAYDYDKMNERDEVGIARGLAWTQVGGDTLSIEVNVMEGNGKLELTGQLGDVMRESAKIALSYIRSQANKLQIDPDFYKTKDIHLHVPEGATPKEGPSAGITIATAMISALTGFRVKRTVAMTGEITLRGHVLPIGGLREKAIAAFRAGIRTIIIPKKNEKDLEDIKEEVKQQLHFVLVESMEDVLKAALTTRETKKSVAASPQEMPEEKRGIYEYQ